MAFNRSEYEKIREDQIKAILEEEKIADQFMQRLVYYYDMFYEQETRRKNSNPHDSVKKFLTLRVGIALIRGCFMHEVNGPSIPLNFEKGKEMLHFILFNSSDCDERAMAAQQLFLVYSGLDQNHSQKYNLEKKLLYREVLKQCATESSLSFSMFSGAAGRDISKNFSSLDQEHMEIKLGKELVDVENELKKRLARSKQFDASWTLSNVSSTLWSSLSGAYQQAVSYFAVSEDGMEVDEENIKEFPGNYGSFASRGFRVKK